MSERKIKKRFLRQEKARLARRIFRIRVIVNEILQESFGRRLYNLKHDDELRLLTLYAWRDRYKVTIKWILKTLIPIWHKKFARFKVRSALGCRVATLVGKKSEEIIREKLWRDFPHKENVKDWKQKEKQRILELVGGRSNRRKARYESIVEAPNPESFIKQYKREIKWQTSEMKMSSKNQKEVSQLKHKNFRNNPWQ